MSIWLIRFGLAELKVRLRFQRGTRFEWWCLLLERTSKFDLIIKIQIY